VWDRDTNQCMTRERFAFVVAEGILDWMQGYFVCHARIPIPTRHDLTGSMFRALVCRLGVDVFL
jgi:hypothetical protein